MHVVRVCVCVCVPGPCLTCGQLVRNEAGSPVAVASVLRSVPERTGPGSRLGGSVIDGTGKRDC